MHSHPVNINETFVWCLVCIRVLEQFKQKEVEENGVVSSSKMQTENKDPTE